MPDDEKKIIIDEGWKARVERERQEAAAKKPEPEAQPEEEAPEEVEASFLTLVTSLATQAMFALGLIAPEGAKEVMVDLPGAKFCIDTLAMLRDKTKGNLTGEESKQLEEAIAQLQQVFVVRGQQAQASTMKNAGIDPNNLRESE